MSISTTLGSHLFLHLNNLILHVKLFFLPLLGFYSYCHGLMGLMCLLKQNLSKIQIQITHYTLHIIPLHPKVFRLETNLSKHMQLETTRKIKLGNKNMGFRGIFRMTMKKAILQLMELLQT